MAPAKTGNLVTRSRAVTTTDHRNSGNVAKDCRSEAREHKIVLIKFTDPRIDLTPAICSLKIAISTEAPEWNFESESGG